MSQPQFSPPNSRRICKMAGLATHNQPFSTQRRKDAETQRGHGRERKHSILTADYFLDFSASLRLCVKSNTVGPSCCGVFLSDLEFRPDKFLFFRPSRMT